MLLVDEQNVFIRILGTNYKRYRTQLQASQLQASQLQGAQLQQICWPSSVQPGWREAGMTWSRDDVKQGWLRQDDARRPITCLIRMDCARLHVENFATPSLISLFCSPLPPYQNLCLHWEVEMSFETWVPPLPGSKHLKINHFPLHQHLPLKYWLV